MGKRTVRNTPEPVVPRLFPVGVLGCDHARRARQPERFHLSVRTTAELDHLNRLVEVVANAHSSGASYFYRFVNNLSEFPVRRVAQGGTQLPGSPILFPPLVSAAYLFERGAHFWYVVLSCHIVLFYCKAWRDSPRLKGRGGVGGTRRALRTWFRGGRNWRKGGC